MAKKPEFAQFREKYANLLSKKSVGKSRDTVPLRLRIYLLRFVYPAHELCFYCSIVVKVRFVYFDLWDKTDLFIDEYGMQKLLLITVQTFKDCMRV